MNKNCGCCGCHLHPLALGFAGGVLWALSVFVIGVISSLGITYGSGFISAVSAFYLGYTPTFLGSIIGAIWAFFDAGIGLLIFAWLYNRFTKCRCKTEENTEKKTEPTQPPAQE